MCWEFVKHPDQAKNRYYGANAAGPINLASFGNRTPHVHWHVIPRYHDDAHFPDPVWGIARRAVRVPQAYDMERVLEYLGKSLAALAWQSSHTRTVCRCKQKLSRELLHIR